MSLILHPHPHHSMLYYLSAGKVEKHTKLNWKSANTQVKIIIIFSREMILFYFIQFINLSSCFFAVCQKLSKIFIKWDKIEFINLTEHQQSMTCVCMSPVIVECFHDIYMAWCWSFVAGGWFAASWCLRHTTDEARQL